MSDKVRATFHPHDELTRWAWTQMVSVKLWRDEKATSAFIDHLVQRPMPGYERTDTDRHVAASFGRFVHDHPTEKPQDWPDECGEACAILPCVEADASVVMIRVEVNVRKLDEQ